MSNLKRAKLIQQGEKIQLPEFFTVADMVQYGNHLVIRFEGHENINLGIGIDNYLAVQDTDAILDAYDMTELEKMDRLEALLSQIGGNPSLMEALAILVEMEVFDTTRLAQLTNDLGPFEIANGCECGFKDCIRECKTIHP
jgi:hypothetical protein